MEIKNDSELEFYIGQIIGYAKLANTFYTESIKDGTLKISDFKDNGYTCMSKIKKMAGEIQEYLVKDSKIEKSVADNMNGGYR